MLKWDVWQLSQADSRKVTDPKQPNDGTKDRRYFVIISPNPHLKTSKTAVCLPIQTVSDASSFSVQVYGKPSPAGIPYDSYIRCTDFYTLDKGHFKTRMGHLTKSEQDNVDAAIRDFFSLY